jgi:hypothetical protein
LAEGAGFEPAIRFPAYTLSRRAPSAARPPLRRACRHKREPRAIAPPATPAQAAALAAFRAKARRKPMKGNKSKKAFISFYFLFRIESFQRVTRDSNKKIPPPRLCTNLGVADPFCLRLALTAQPLNPPSRKAITRGSVLYKIMSIVLESRLGVSRLARRWTAPRLGSGSRFGARFSRPRATIQSHYFAV